MSENSAGANGDAAPRDNAGEAAEEIALGDELGSAASPFLYLLSALVIAVAAYLLYTLFHS
jgi:hypothetical protein